MAPLRVGVIFEETQLSDLIGIDLIGNCGKPLISCMTEFGYPDLVSKAYDIEFLYISSSLDAAITTPGVRVLPTHTYDNAPRNLDIILVGGPHPKHRPAASLKFFREAVKESKVILSVCTGSMWLAASGILDGKKATTNRFFIPAAKKLYPEVEWLDQRWVVDESTSAAGEGGGRGGAHLWIAGAADCGIEMVAKYILQTFDADIAQLACEAIGFHPQHAQRGQFYHDDDDDRVVRS